MDAFRSPGKPVEREPVPDAEYLEQVRRNPALDYLRRDNPLDMLFVDSTGTIRNIKQNAVPYSEDIIDSMTSVKYVIELNAGVTAKLGIKTGDRVMSATTTKRK